MADLFEIYPDTNNEPSVDLLDKYNYENEPGTQEEALELAKKRIGQKFPNLPDWLREAILNITPKDNSPILASAARGVSNVTDYIPAAAGGFLQGASLPIRGAASLIPTEIAQDLANSQDLTNLFSPPTTEGQKGVQQASEFLGALGPLGKLFGTLKGGAEVARIPKSLQNASALGGTGYIGTPGDVENKTIGAAEALALGGAGKIASKAGSKLATLGKGLFSESNPDLLIESIQKPHDVLERSANELYGQVNNAIKKRGIKTPISEKLTEQLKEHFPKNTRSYQELIEKAKQGDYDAIHKIQSSLYKKGTKALASDDLAVENQGEDILDLRDKINDELNNKLIKEGHLDIAHVLGQGKKLYSELQKTYYDKLLPKGIGKLVHPETRLIPENPETLFKQQSVPMRRFLEKHPEVKKHVKGIKDKKEAIKTINNIMLKSAGTGGLLFTGKSIYDLLK